jgi:dephospho-CoA kinase
VPLLTEISAADRYDRVLLVDCDESVQRARLMGRDGASAAQADAALAAQATRAARRAVASDVIENGGERGALAAQVHRLHAQYLALARGD